VLEHALFNAALPYRVYGGMRFFERQEIKHALAYLRLIANPDDDNALLRVVNFPTRGIGLRSLEQLQDDALHQEASIWAAMLKKCGAGAIPGKDLTDPASETVRRMTDFRKSGKASKGVEGFVALVESMRQIRDRLSLPEIVEHMLEHSGLRAHYRSEREGVERLENLDELINAATNFVHEAEDDSLLLFLSHASLEAGEHQAAGGQDALQLMTVHSAKGLEFHSVFLSGLEEGLFPHDNSRNETGGLEEERRLMYVALTRARRRLYLSFAQSRLLHGQIRYNIPSRFLQEIPDSLLKWLQPLQKAPVGNYPSIASGPSPGQGMRNQEPVARDSAASRWRVGQNVVHAKFGAGVIISCEGNGADARVEVKFGRAGTKWLLLEYAKLAPA
jgi:DNA helicase-2/ATP-dependent DNA helicase PcrA